MRQAAVTLFVCFLHDNPSGQITLAGHAMTPPPDVSEMEVTCAHVCVCVCVCVAYTQSIKLVNRRVCGAEHTMLKTFHLSTLTHTHIVSPLLPPHIST